MDLTYNDYFTTTGHGKDWRVHVKQCTEDHASYYEESIRAAKLVEKTSLKPIVLMFSGGIDGEWMINIFKDAQVEFKVAIISYGKWNEHDAKYAFDYCKSHGIVPEVIEIDLEKFIDSGKIYEIAREAKCCVYQFPGVMYGMTKIDGTIVMANGEPQVNLMPDGTWHWEETERINSYMNWYTSQGIDGTPDFMRYTPEQTVSFLNEPLVKQLINGELENQWHTVSIKHALFNQHFNQVERPKFTGWERMERSPFFEDCKVIQNFTYMRENYNGIFTLEYNKLCQLLTKWKREIRW